MLANMQASAERENRNVGKFRAADENGGRYDLMYFGDLDRWHDFLAGHFGVQEVDRLYREGSDNICISIVYYPDINVYRGREELQMIMQDYSC